MDAESQNQDENQILDTLGLSWKRTNADDEKSLPRVNWDALREYAARLMHERAQKQREGQPAITCKIAVPYNMGGVHLVRLLHFSNGARWVARIRLHEWTPASKERLLQEVHTISLLRERTTIPVPEVFGYESDNSNPVGAAFMLMEFVPGDTAMDSFGGWHKHHGEIPAEHKPKFYRSMARYQAELASLRFPRIGSIIRHADGSYDIGPMPDLGGPFDTVSEFLQAWARNAKFPTSENTMRKQLPPNLADEVISSIQSFPDDIRTLAEQGTFTEKGPFPLYHTDLYHSNVIIDPDYNILAVIDWENACTFPWELVEFPQFLSSVPQPMDAPWNYHDNGDPKDEDIKQRWLERREYIDSVKQAEQACSFDNRLSTILSDRRLQDLASAIKLYLDSGKYGFYNKVLDQFRS